MGRARWRDHDGTSLEHCTIRASDDGVVVDSVVVGAAFAIRYRIVCDTQWRTRAVNVDLIGEPRGVHLVADGAGTWWQESRHVAILDGAVDVDITATPFTNTLPIRRLHLAIGQSKDLRVAYITVPEMSVSLHPQRYTRLADRTFRFESLDSDFTKDLTVDEHSLVVHYPGLFERVA